MTVWSIFQRLHTIHPLRERI